MDPQDLETDDYARQNGLTVDYSKADIFSLFADIQNQIVHLFPPADLDESTALIWPPVSHLNYRHEQADISRPAIELLADAIARPENDQWSALPSSRQFAKLKFEVPLLHEYAWRKMLRATRERRKPNLDLTNVPSEPLDTSNDESLEFPDSTSQYLEELITEIHDEKLDVPRQALHCLFQVLRDEWTRDKQAELMDELQCFKKFRAPVITPPLSPVTQNEDYFTPNEEVCGVMLSSDPSTLFEDDLRKAEAHLFQQDVYYTDGSSPLRIETPNMSPVGEPPLLALNEPSLQSLKIECPLTPLNSTPPSLGLEIDMPGFANGMGIDQDVNKEDPDSLDVQGEKGPMEIFDSLTLQILKENAESVKRGVEQEQLQTADAIARIEIPKLDFTIPDPEWQKVLPDAALQLVWIEKTREASNIPPWLRNSNAERGLRWSPFDSRDAHISTKESIDNDDEAEALLDFQTHVKVLTSADYVWKQPGLAILREEEEDEEEQLDLSTVKEDRDIESLVRKRKYELENIDLESKNTSESSSPIDLIQFPGSTASALSQTRLGGHDRLPRLLLGCNDASATSTLLSNYVDIHTTKRRKQDKSSFFPTPAKPMVQVDVAAPKTAVATVEPKIVVERVIELEQELTIPAPFPTIQAPAEQTKIIKALSLSRNVFSLLEKLYPNAEIIERDFDRWNTLTWDRNSVSRSPVASPLAAEADVIVSPTTGIVVTTLLKAMQKPLPGHKGESATRERIRGVAARYERLIVLVSEASRVDETARELAPSECAGYAEFAGFIAGLDANAQAYYVGGGDGTLAKWLVSFLIRYAPEAAAVQHILIQDESLWELFLRRAGMNAYAAQAVLGQLKAPDGTPMEEAGRYGLPAFIRMTPMERVQNFGMLMGGDRVLNRVNEVLETQWT